MFLFSVPTGSIPCCTWYRSVKPLQCISPKGCLWWHRNWLFLLPLSTPFSWHFRIQGTRLKKPRQNPGRLHYPDESPHVFEKYWDYLPYLDQHPDFSSESECARHHVLLFSQGISAMLRDDDQWGPQPAAETSTSEQETAEDALLYRLRPIQDGTDQGEEHRSSAATGLGGPAPG
jgi:hypothetical protein